MQDMSENYFLEQFKQLSLKWPKLLEYPIEDISRYVSMLWQANQRMNLFSRKIPVDELLKNHIIDCMIGFEYFQDFHSIADLGTGGGLPGVLLAICFAEKEIHLYEKSEKKKSFLKECALIWKNIKLHSQVETPATECITARAFKPFLVIQSLTINFQGSYLLYKARAESIADEMGVIPYKLIKLENPFLDTERHLVRTAGKLIIA